MNLRDPSAPALDSLIDKVQSRLNARATAATREWWTKYLRGAASFRGAKMTDVRTAVHAWFEDELALQDEHSPRPRERPQETSEIATRKAPTGWRC